MRYPPRFGHLATRPVVISKLVNTYAAAHSIEEDEAQERLERALSGNLHEELLAATWEALAGGTKRLTEEGLLEKVASTLKDRPLKRSKAAPVNPAWSAFLVLADLEAGTATEAARRALDNEQGRQMLKKGLMEAGKFLATELGKGK